MSTTTNTKSRNSRVFLAIVTVEILAVVVFWFYGPHLVTRMTVDKEEVGKQLAEIKEREAKRTEQLREKRKETKVNKKNLKIVAKQEEESRKDKIRERLDELNDIREDIQEVRNEKLRELERKEEQVAEDERFTELKKNLEAVKEEAVYIHRKVTEEIADKLHQDTEELAKKSLEAIQNRSGAIDEEVEEKLASIEAELDEIDKINKDAAGNMGESSLGPPVDSSEVIQQADNLRRDIRDYYREAQNNKQENSSDPNSAINGLRRDIASIRQDGDDLLTGKNESSKKLKKALRDLGREAGRQGNRKGSKLDKIAEAIEAVNKANQKKNAEQPLSTKLKAQMAELKQKLDSIANSEKEKQQPKSGRVAQAESKLRESLQEFQDAAHKLEEGSDSSQASDLKRVADELSKSLNNATTLDKKELQSAREELKQVTNKARKLYQSQRKAEGTDAQAITHAYRQHLSAAKEHLARLGVTKTDPKHDISAMLEETIEREEPAPDATLDELLQAASKTESKIIEDYASLRAAELALIQNESFGPMREKTAQTLDSDKTEIPEEVFTKKFQGETLGDLDAHKENLDKAVKAADEMWQGAKTKQQQARAMSSEGKEDQRQLTNSEVDALRQSRQAIAEAGQKQYSEGATVDFTSLMRRAYHQGGDTAGNRPLYENNIYEGGDEMGVRTFSPSGNVDTRYIKANALPGRRFTKESTRKGFLYIDTWYVIGPWENYGQVNWKQTHPPEFGVDLSRKYKGGKDDKELKWQFLQSDRMRITPTDERRDSTYYAYTEVFFDESHEMLLAIASDDAAKIWVNDLLVWEDEGLSSWSLDEGFRRVLFKKGFNTILLRIENGPGVCQYSLLLCPPDMND